MNKLGVCVLIVLAASVASTAHAEGLYVGGGAGSLDFDLSSTAGRFDLDGTAYKLYVGYGIRQWLGFDAQYVFLDGAEATVTDTTAEVDLGLLSLYARFVGRFSPRLELYGKIGGTSWSSDTTLRTADEDPVSDSSSGTAFSWGAGFGYYVTEKLSLRLEYDTFGDLGDEVENVKMISGAVQFNF